MAIQVISDKFPIRGVASSMIGGRAENQDDWGYIDTPLGFLVVVCDGMGGGPGGKTASYIVKNELMKVLCSCSPQMSRTQALQKAVSIADDALYAKMEEHPQLKGMGSTLVAVLINEESAMVVHLGDSRCYRIQGGKRVVFRTSDHSLVNELVRNKAITEEEARTSPQSNVIMRALGSTSNHTPEIEELPFRKGDRFILCTDGVWGVMPAQELEMRFTGYPDMESLVMNLDTEIDRIGVSQGGHHDNHTIAVIETMMDSRLKDKMSRHIQIIVGTLSAFLLVSIVLNIYFLVRSGKEVEDLKEGMGSLISEVERLKPYELRYNQLSEGGNLASEGVINLLNRENDSLRNELDMLRAELEALEKAENGNASAEEEKKRIESPEMLLEKILANLEQMKTMSGDTETDLSKAKQQYRNKVVEQLRQFDKLTEQRYVSETEVIRAKLRDGSVAMLVDQPGQDGRYRSTQKAQEALENIQKTLENIKDEL